MEITPLIFDEDSEAVVCDACMRENSTYEIEIGAFNFIVCPRCVQSLRKSLDLIETDE